MKIQAGTVIEFEGEDGRTFKGPITYTKLQQCDAGDGVVLVKVWFQGQEPTETGETGEGEGN